jgi:hydroxymethylpyrimidine pyrophosphatase-like HAD family hydrolase
MVTTPIQLISTDFDGTMVSESETFLVAPRLQDLLRELQANGAHWVINTGRDFVSLSAALRQAQMTVAPDFLVLVEREIFVRKDGGFVGLEEWNGRCAADHNRLFAEVRGDVPQLAAWVRARFDARVYEDPWSPFCLVARCNEDADAILAYLEDYCREVPQLTVVRNDVYARFSHAGYSKGTALAEIARRLGVSTGRIFAAGDHLNDLSMLTRQRAAWLVAPANAVPAVKTAVLEQGGYISGQPHGHGVSDGLLWALAGGKGNASRMGCG